MKLFGDGGTSDNCPPFEDLYLQSCLCEVGGANSAIVAAADHHNVKVDLMSWGEAQRLHFQICPGYTVDGWSLLATIHILTRADPPFDAA